MSDAEPAKDETVTCYDWLGNDLTRPKKKRTRNGPAVGSTLMAYIAASEQASSSASATTSTDGDAIGLDPSRKNKRPSFQSLVRNCAQLEMSDQATSSAPATTSTSDDDLGFDPSKKKRKKPRIPTTDAEIESCIIQAVCAPALDQVLELQNAREVSSTFAPITTPVATSSKDDFDYSYTKLLSRIYEQIVIDKVSTGDSRDKKAIAPPEIGKIGTKKTAWVNFVSNCKSINRDANKVMLFVLAELGTTGAIDGNAKLIIKGRFTSKQFESILTKYIREYVACNTCHYLNTHVRRENRVWLKVCQDCGASSSVSAVQQGFRVQTKRKKT